MGTSIPNRKNETQGQGAGEVVSITLTPEQMAKEMERLNKSKGAVKPVGKMKHSRDDYLKLRAEGKSASQIAKTFGMTAPAMGYWLDKWEIKEKEAEAAAVTEFIERAAACSTDTGVEAEAAEEPTEAEADPRIAELEMRLNEQYEESGRLAAENVELISELAKMTDKFKELEVESSEPSSPRILSAGPDQPSQEFISFILPLIHITEEPGVKRERALERLCDINDRLVTGDVEYPRLATETLELLQVVVSLVHVLMTDLHPTGQQNVHEYVQEFFNHYSSHHIRRVNELAAVHEWSTVTV